MPNIRAFSEARRGRRKKIKDELVQVASNVMTGDVGSAIYHGAVALSHTIKPDMELVQDIVDEVTVGNLTIPEILAVYRSNRLDPVIRISIKIALKTLRKRGM